MKLSEEELEYHMGRLARMAEDFEKLYNKKEYGRAHWILLKAEVIASYLELPTKMMSLLFGQWEDDGKEDVEHPQELFNQRHAEKVDWHCCVKAHQTYQDIANRRNGVPLQYYSDPEYCSLKCRHAIWNNARIISEEMQ